MTLICRAGFIPPLHILLSLLLFVTLLTAPGCTGKIPEDQFRKVYTDLLIAQDSLGRDRQATEKIKEALYKKHGITKARFDKTINYYKENPEEWTALYDTLIKVTEKRINANERGN